MIVTSAGRNMESSKIRLKVKAIEDQGYQVNAEHTGRCYIVAIVDSRGKVAAYSKNAYGLDYDGAIKAFYAPNRTNKRHPYVPESDTILQGRSR